jgi:hypothetical protein
MSSTLEAQSRPNLRPGARSPRGQRPDTNDAATPSPEARELLPLRGATRGASRPIIPCEIIARPASHR